MADNVQSPVCAIPDCTRRRHSRGWCSTHYERWRIHGDPTHETYTVICTIDGCDKRHLSRGMCTMHYTRWLRHGDPLVSVAAQMRHTAADECGSDGCAQPRRKREYCERHYQAVYLPTMSAATQARRRARKRSAVCEHGPQCVSAQVIAELLMNPCLYCGGKAEHADHFYPVARGGSHCRDNLAAACAACNSSKHARDPWLWWSSREDVA